MIVKPITYEGAPAFHVRHDAADWMLAYDPIVDRWSVYADGACVCIKRTKWQALESLVNLTLKPWTY